MVLQLNSTVIIFDLLQVERRFPFELYLLETLMLN